VSEESSSEKKEKGGVLIRQRKGSVLRPREEREAFAKSTATPSSPQNNNPLTEERAAFAFSKEG